MFCIFRAATPSPWWALYLALLLTACTTTGRATEVTTGCEWTKPILVSRQDVLTDLTARQILAHNETGRRLCHWGSDEQQGQQTGI